MLEIIAVIMFCSKIGDRLRRRGHKPTAYQWMAVGMWIGGEFAGFMLMGSATGEFAAAYLGGLLGAACGAGVAWTIVCAQPDISRQKYDRFRSGSAFDYTPPVDEEPFDPTNPYASPRARETTGKPQPPRTNRSGTDDWLDQISR